jgi:CRISPR-associated protein Cst2
MSLHVFANFVTPFGTAANNRGDSEGSNITPLQKLLWLGETHTTVSAEAIRFALRRVLGASQPTNRVWNEEARANIWQDHKFKGWASKNAETFIDDDLLGFMSAEAAKEDGSEGGKGSVNTRRAVLEVTRAVSLTPWAGDVTFNAASPGATPSASKGDKDKSKNPVPYGTEVHATRYQYGVALTPERLRDKRRAAEAMEALCNLGTVAGNHGRFLFDFSPEAVVIRLTHDPAPRLLYCFATTDEGKTVVAPALMNRLANGDIDAKELILGVTDLNSTLAATLKEHNVPVFGVRSGCAEAVKRINTELKNVT